MAFLRLIKYPGAKSVLIPEIKRIFRSSGLHIFVDVFGGSGSVSLNVKADQVVFNDYESELADMFRAIQEKSVEVRKMISKILRYQDVKYGISGTRRSLVSKTDQRGETLLVDAIERWEMSRRLLTKAGQASLKRSLDLLSREEKAVFTIYRFSSSFGGMGNTYATAKEKSVHRYISMTLENYAAIENAVKKWKIENMDFRDLIKKYDNSRTFFYLDPPYVGKQWYNYNFTKKDFVDIKTILDTLNGKYLMNLNADVEYFKRIFGDPTFVKYYPNSNTKSDEKERRVREKGFYTNVKND
ncbi:MAG: DNA adenine methylase [Thermoplasmataceae archaeon]|jgi:DNA adenine methylase